MRQFVFGGGGKEGVSIEIFNAQKQNISHTNLEFFCNSRNIFQEGFHFV